MKDSYLALLAEYASGSLDEAHSLAVAAHLSLSPSARAVICHYEKVGGAMLSIACAPVAMSAGGFDSVLARIDGRAAAPAIADKAFACSNARDMPDCLRSYLEKARFARSETAAARRRYVLKRLATDCPASAAHMLDIGPDARLTMRLDHPHVLMVLEGTVVVDGETLARGDLAVLERGTVVEITAAADGSLCLVVRQARNIVRELFLPWIRPKRR